MNDAEFDQFLKNRTVSEPVPASFRREVWARIEAKEKDSWFGVTTQFLKQSLAGAACLGMAFGFWLGNAQPGATKVAYLESINPLSHSTHLHR